MAVGSKEEPMNPVHLYAHGSTMMLGEEHNSGNYWKKCGEQALANGIEHVVVMVSECCLLVMASHFGDSLLWTTPS